MLDSQSCQSEKVNQYNLTRAYEENVGMQNCIDIGFDLFFCVRMEVPLHVIT